MGSLGALAAGGRGTPLPQRQAAQQDQREDGLHQGDGPVACLPAVPRRENGAQDHGADDGAHAPHAVEPAHVAAGIVEGNVVIQGSVHASGTQPVGDGPKAKLPEGPGCRVAKEGCGSQRYADRCDNPSAEPPGKAVTGQAGKDGAQRNEEGQEAHIGDRHTKDGVDHGPGGTL